MPEAVLLVAALLTCLVGMGWLALAMETHWSQVRGGHPSRAGALRLRIVGTLALMASLALCLSADHASMALLVWVMALAGAALAVALTLTWRPRWLRLLAWAGT